MDEGAMVLGKTNLDQFACGLNGTQSPFGVVHNAINPEYVSGGAASGSAYVVATGQVDFALGTDTAGSGRVPAGLNNIVGLKPSRGLVSTNGVVPACASIDCVSIMARSVDVAWKVLTVAMGFDPEDPNSRLMHLKCTPFPSAFRFGIPRQQDLQFFGDRESEEAFQASIAGLQKVGGQAVEIDFTVFHQVTEMLYTSPLMAERYAWVQPIFDRAPQEFMEPIKDILQAGKAFSAADIFLAQHKLRKLAQEAAKSWMGVDLLVVPTAPTHYKIADMLQQPQELNKRLGHYTTFVNLLDYAAVSVPSVLKAGGLPHGVSLIGPAGSDFQLAELGHRFQHTQRPTLGATGQPLPAFEPLAWECDEARVRVAVVGVHMSGMPLHHRLTERSARLVQKCKTAPAYQLYALPGTVPPRPGLLYVGNSLYCQENSCYLQAPCPHSGAAIEVEVYELSAQHFGTFTAMIPSPLAMGTVELEDGSSVKGLVAEPHAFQGATNVTHFGSWRAFLGSLA